MEADNLKYGECIHHNNLATCQVCKPQTIQVIDYTDDTIAKKSLRLEKELGMYKRLAETSEKTIQNLIDIRTSNLAEINQLKEKLDKANHLFVKVINGDYGEFDAEIDAFLNDKLNESK